ncbi:hypothetical protein Naga_102557g1 [Nannochloropsis gaditana]|uniref:Uncharacterized protein n=1 Tax=Nannochloropsis gaditana TaxID=72520 RepID=W7SYN7_9STRA|nr:hypothetical protein Naga_102557g1 [Nannochloropsis gaditana]
MRHYLQTQVAASPGNSWMWHNPGSPSRRRRRGGGRRSSLNVNYPPASICSSTPSIYVLPLLLLLLLCIGSTSECLVHAFLLPGSIPSRSKSYPVTRRQVSERQIPQYRETMKLYYWNDSSPITPVQFDQERDFNSFLGDAALVGKAGEVGRRRPSAAERKG